MANINLSDILHNRPLIEPQIYGYIIPDVKDHEGFIKIGYTDRVDVEKRINEQLHTATIKHKTLFIESAMRNDGTVFTDKDVHNLLERKGFKKKIFEGGTNNEWFKCSINDAQLAIKEIRNYARYEGNRTEDFKMRDEQANAVE